MAYLHQMFPDNRIRELRKAAGLTQGELGEKVGLHQTQIGKIENSDRNLTIEWARRIAAALNVNVADILGEADNPMRLSDEEQALIRQFREATQEQREFIQRVAAPVSAYTPQPGDDKQAAA